MPALPALLLLSLSLALSERPPDDPRLTPRVREMKTEAIKSRILSQVNLPEAPIMLPPDQPVNVPKSILELVERKEPESSAIAEGENLVTYPLVNGNITCVNKTSKCVKFEFELPSDSKPVSSIHVWVRKFMPSEILTVSACLSSSLDGENQECEYEETLNKIRTEVGWEIYELSAKYVFDLRLELPFCAVHVIGSSVQDLGDQKPFLVSNISPAAAGKAERTRRSASRNCTCCLVNFYVSFKEIGWHWVVAPLGFSANMCYGKCSNQINSYPSHYHRMLSTILNNKTVPTDKKEPLWTPCCSPTKLSPLDMIYVAGNSTNSNSTSSFIYHKIPDMITESCGCW